MSDEATHNILKTTISVGGMTCAACVRHREMKTSHGHDHEISNYSHAFAIGITLNVIFVVIEASCGVVAGSLALIADAGHNLSDVLSLLLAWGANLLASKQPTEKRTYGFRRVTILASLTSAICMLNRPKCI